MHSEEFLDAWAQKLSHIAKVLRLHTTRVRQDVAAGKRIEYLENVYEALSKGATETRELVENLKDEEGSRALRDSMTSVQYEVDNLVNALETYKRVIGND